MSSGTTETTGSAGRFVAALLSSTPTGFAAAAAARQLDVEPQTAERLGRDHFERLTQDTELRLLYLAESLHVDRPELFLDHLAWSKVTGKARGVTEGDLDRNLCCLRDELSERLPPNARAAVVELLESGRQRLAEAPDQLASLLDEEAPHSDLMRLYLNDILEGRRDAAVDRVVEALETGISSNDLYRDVIGRAQGEIGRMWQRGEVHVGEEHFATQVAESALAAIRARVPASPRNGKRVLVTAVRGDLHETGVHVLADSFSSAGWEPVILGSNMPPDDTARAARDFRVDLVALSAHLHLHVRSTEEVILALRSDPDVAQIPIIVGGPPFNVVADLWEIVGADACAVDAVEAITVANRLTEAA